LSSGDGTDVHIQRMRPECHQHRVLDRSLITATLRAVAAQTARSWSRLRAGLAVSGEGRAGTCGAPTYASTRVHARSFIDTSAISRTHPITLPVT
jgi:hypothetical protein